MVVLTGAAGIPATPAYAVEARRTAGQASVRQSVPSGRRRELWYSSSCQEERGVCDSWDIR